MTNTVLYLKTQQNAEVMQTRVCVRDIASVYCANKEALTKVKQKRLRVVITLEL